MIFDHPVPQTVQDHLLHHRMVAVERIAAAAEIVVIPIRRQHVVHVIIDALQ